MKTLLIGYYGHGNLGDDALERLSREWVLKCDPDGEVTASKLDFFSADRVAFGGGGLFQNVTSFRSLMWYCAWAYLAKLFGKPYGLLGQGIGPVSGRLSNLMLNKVLKYADFVTVRDEVSYRRVKKVSDCVQGPDMTFFSDVHEGYDSEGLVGLNLRPFRFLEEEWMTTLQDVSNIFLSFSPDDNEYSGKLNSIDMSPYFVEGEEMPQKLSGVISMRFHACVWAALNGVPFLALVYDEKVKLLADMLGQLYVDLRDEKSRGGVKNSVKSFLSSVDYYHDILIENRELVRDVSNVHLQELKEFYDA